MSCLTAKDLWDTLADMFSQRKNFDRIYNLYKQFFTLSRGEKSVTQYFIQMRGLLQDIQNFHPLDSDVSVTRRQRNQVNVTRFLDGLGSEFDSVRAQILAAGEDNLTLEDVYNKVLNAESTCLSSLRSSSENNSALKSAATFNSHNYFSKSKGSNDKGKGKGNGRKGDRKCMHCGRNNHDSKRC